MGLLIIFHSGRPSASYTSLRNKNGRPSHHLQTSSPWLLPHPLRSFFGCAQALLACVVPNIGVQPQSLSSALVSCHLLHSPFQKRPGFLPELSPKLHMFIEHIHQIVCGRLLLNLPQTINSPLLFPPLRTLRFSLYTRFSLAFAISVVSE